MLPRLFFPLIACFFVVSYSWHNIEHAVIAQIAEKYAYKLSFEKVKRVVELIADEKNTTREYLEAACWADVVKKTKPYEHTVPWHFIRNGYSDDGTKIVNHDDKENIILQLNRLIKEIDQDDESETTAISLRFLIHLMGDVHQPLHNLEYFSEKFPQDGYDFIVQMTEGNKTIPKPLHFLTDCVFGNFSDAPLLPFTGELSDEIVNRAIDVSSYCEDMTLAGFDYNPQAWSEEAYNIGKEIYKTVNYMNILNEEQIEHVQTLLLKQMCRAGKRLALTYSLIYDKFPPPSDFYIIMIAFASLLCVVVLDEVYHGGSCSQRRREYMGIETNKKKVKFDFGNSKVLSVCYK